MEKFTNKKITFFSFVSMLFLVFVHSYNLNNTELLPYSTITENLSVTTFTEHLLVNGLLRFRIPILFLISGYLFARHSNNNFGKTLKKRLRTLVVPYLIWSAVGILVTYLYQLSSLFPAVGNIYSNAGTVASLSFTDLFFTWIKSPYAFQLWFIRVLFMLNLLYPVINYFIKKFPLPFFVFAAFTWIVSYKQDLFMGEGFFFFSAGVWLCKTNFNLSVAPKWLNVKISLFIFLFCAVVKTWLAFRGNALLGEMVNKYFLIILYRITEISGLLTLWFGMEKAVLTFMANKHFAYSSSFGFIIYAVHAPVCVFVMDAMLALTKDMAGSRLICFLISPLFIIAFCLFFGATLRKYMPWIYKISTGGRGTADPSVLLILRMGSFIKRGFVLNPK